MRSKDKLLHSHFYLADLNTHVVGITRHFTRALTAYDYADETGVGSHTVALTGAHFLAHEGKPWIIPGKETAP